MIRYLLVLLYFFSLGSWTEISSHAQGQSFGGGTSSPLPATVAPRTVPGGPSTSAPTPLTQLAPVPNSPTLAVPSPYANPASPGGSFSTLPPSAVSLGAPTFDPYGPPTGTPSLSQSMGSIFGGTAGATTGYSLAPPAPYGGSDPYATTPSPYGSSPGVATAPAYPSSIYPGESPPVLFPGGFMGAGMAATPGSYYNPMGEFAMPSALKLFQGPRFRHGWVGGGDGPTDLGMHESEVSIAAAFPNFLGSNQPIYVVPSFALDLWSGPADGVADLPANAYEAFVDVGWQTDPNQILGLELGTRIGVFTDFDTYNDDSWRVLGKALGKFRLSPTTTLKAGVMYVDRVKIKLIPAGGVLWQPNPFWRWDIYFPEPKISRYWQTLGTNDVWGYIAAEYGGGSWTITRASGIEDQVDINDIRVLLGFEWGRSEWIRQGRRTAFIEAGWVFEREIVYRRTGGDMDPDSTFIIRGGVGY